MLSRYKTKAIGDAVIFNVSDQWRISGNAYAWRIQRYAGVFAAGPRLNEPKWHSVKYYRDLEGARKALGGLMIREAHTNNERQALAAVERVAAAIKAAGL